MEASRKTAVIVLSAAVAAVVAIPLAFYVSTYESHLEFSLSINDNGSDADELILILPLPQEPKLLERIDQQQLSISAFPIELPYTYSSERINTSSGEVTMLRIRIDVPSSDSGGSFSLNLGAHIQSDHRIDVSNPVGSEYLLEPMTNVTSGTEIDQSFEPSPYDAVFQSDFYTNYVGNESSDGITIGLDWIGWNEWWFIGSNGANFWQVIHITLESYNPLPFPIQIGWNTVQGGIWTG